MNWYDVCVISSYAKVWMVELHSCLPHYRDKIGTSRERVIVLASLHFVRALHRCLRPKTTKLVKTRAFRRQDLYQVPSLPGKTLLQSILTSLFTKGTHKLQDTLFEV